MSIKAVKWALNDVRCQPDYKVILIALADRSDDAGLCYPSQSEISDKTCIPLRTLKRKMQHLADMQVVDIITQQVRRDRRKNTYRLRLERCFDLIGAKKPSKLDNGANLAPIDDLTPDVSRPPEAQWCQSDTIPSATVAPSSGKKGATEAPTLVPERHLSKSRGHLDGTHIGATHVAYEPSDNHQYNNSNTAAGDACDVYTRKDPRGKIELTHAWRPSQHVFDQLRLRGISADQAEEWIPEFAIYHRGKSDRQAAFDAKFLKHCIVLFEKGKCEPRPISKDWQPDAGTVQLLRTDGIGLDFIWDCVTEFALYWSEARIAQHGWNAKFLRLCRQQWQKRSMSTELAAAGSAQSTLERLTDRSWATS